MSIMTVSTINAQQKLNPEIEKKIDVLMSKMTLEEKVGQMNQYNGFWDVTGPAPVGGTAEQKYRQPQFCRLFNCPGDFLADHMPHASHHKS